MFIHFYAYICLYIHIITPTVAFAKHKQWPGRPRPTRPRAHSLAIHPLCCRSWASINGLTHDWRWDGHQRDIKGSPLKEMTVVKTRYTISGKKSHDKTMVQHIDTILLWVIQDCIFKIMVPWCTMDTIINLIMDTIINMLMIVIHKNYHYGYYPYILIHLYIQYGSNHVIIMVCWIQMDNNIWSILIHIGYNHVM